MMTSPFRNMLQIAVGVIVAAAAIHTWLVMGLVVPMTVAGSSMSPALEGPRLMFRCEACRSEFGVGLDQLIDEDRAVCPHCHQIAARRKDANVRGDRLLVDRTAFLLRQPRRWEVVVFRSPTDAQKMFVKRIAGLPGETVSLREDGVWINGQVVPRPGGESYKLRPGDRNECRLGPAEYFVLGDNGAISDDSRSWLEGPGVDAKLLIGKALGVR